MKYIVSVIVLLIASIASAGESYLYWGKYLNSTLSAYPGSVNRYATNRAGIHIETNPFRYIDSKDFSRMSCFIDNECLIDEAQGFFSNPASMNFKVGVKYSGNVMDVIYQHECKHSFEMRSSRSEQYDMIEFRYKLTGVLE